MIVTSWRTHAAGLAAGLLAAGTVLAPTAAASPAAPPTRTITYHGYQIDVPATWRVVDLAENPRACVRFDTEAIYLGHQTASPQCPTTPAGRTAGLVLEPIAEVPAEQVHDGIARAEPGKATPPRGTASRSGTIQVAVQDAGVLVTAAHTDDNEPAVRKVLDSARLAAGGKRAELPAAAPRSAVTAGVVAPGTFKGKGFDTCAAPSQSAMDAWYASSPYKAVGIYTSGGFRACAQPNLTASWVTRQAAKGWQFQLIDVGRQAPCTSYSSKMSTDPATARQQGRTAADAAINAAAALGFTAGSAIYSDIENYATTASCKASVLSYVSGWTEALHAKGWLSGVYSSASSGIKDLASAYNSTSYTRPDHIWFAWWNNKADVDGGTYVPASYWANHQRIHQYAGDVGETWGGVNIHIDRNYLDVLSGTPKPCDTVSLNFTSYPTVQSGSTGNAVKAAQCLLTTAGHSPGETPTGTFDAATIAATQAFQTARGLSATGVVESRTWTALLSTGPTTQVQNGSTGLAVERLQRALTAALGTTVVIDGDFGPATETAARNYQSSRGLTVDGIVGPVTWGALQAGK